MDKQVNVCMFYSSNIHSIYPYILAQHIGAGKTHTMMGDMIKSEMHPRVGIIPRVVKEIWNRIVHASTNYEFELKVSFLEIYNEQIFDLLSTSNGRKKKQREKLIIREYSDEIYVENLNEIYVRDQNELYDLIKSATKTNVSRNKNESIILQISCCIDHHFRSRRYSTGTVKNPNSVLSI